VGLELHGDAAILTIDDDGKGVEADVIDRPTSLGLIGMRERVLALGGKITISGETGRGTNVTVRAPLIGARG
jgi:signal transduction histidine kinase